MSEEKTVDTTQQLTFGPLPPAELREEAFLVPRPRLMPPGEPNSNSTQLINAINAAPPLTSEELILMQKQINAYFTKQFSNPDFNVRKSLFRTEFQEFCMKSTKSTCIGRLGENSTSIKNLMVSRQPMQSVSMPEEAVAISGSSENSLATKLAKMYPDEIGPDAVERRKKPNIDLDGDDLQEMFAEWLRANDINPEDLAKKRQTLICDTDRDMDVIKVEGIPTMNGIKNLELLVPRETSILGNLKKNLQPDPKDPASNEKFAENYIEMLGLKAEIEQNEQATKMHNRLSSILFRCLLSLVLGYLYNNGLDMLNNAIFINSVDSELAKDLAFQFVQAEVDDGILQDGNYTAIGDRYDTILSLLMKDSVLNPDIKSRIFPDQPDAPLEQGFETLLEMIVRFANMEPGTTATPYFTILQSVCFSITLILNKYELITTAAGELVEPYWEAILYISAEDSTIMQRLQSIIVLAVAYNSYGWLFTVMAPLAIPSVLSVSKWALCSLARLPFGIIKFTGKGLLSVGKFFVGYQEDPNIMPIEAGSENTLIQVGWIKKKIGDDIKLIPHMVSKGDVQRLSHYIANHEIQKPSLLSSIFDAHGVADLNMQAPHGVEQWSFYLKQTNPIGRLICCITEEFAELTVDDTEEVGYVKTLEERMFTLFFRTIRDENADNGFTLQPLVEMWTETLFTKLYQTTDAVINTYNSAIDATAEAFARSSFRDTLLEAIVIMLSSRYVDKTISLGVISPPLSRENSTDSSQVTLEFGNEQPPLASASSTGSTGSNMSTISNRTQNSLGSVAYSYTTTNDDNVDISVSETKIDENTIGINLEIDIQRPNIVYIPEQPDPQRTESNGSTSSTGSTLSTLSKFSSNTGLSPIIRIGRNQLCLRSQVPSLLNPLIDPSALFIKKKTSIFQDIKEKARKIKIEEENRIAEMKRSEEEQTKLLAEMNARFETLLPSDSNTEQSNLSGFIVADAVGSIMDGLVKLSLWAYPPENHAGGYRRRNGPILATIGRKIVNNGIYRAIKPKLIASVYGKSKGRQRKRYTKKHGLKKARKQTTKKIRRKRRSTHKKYKRR